MLNLKDGTLWQWDIGRKMIITLEEGSTIDKVQFYNGIGENAYPATSIEVVNGEILAGIPNSLLCYANNLTVYLMTTDEDGVKTQEQITLVVNKRAKPEDYIFTDDEFHTYKVYDERLQYLEENIVLPDRLKESTDTEVKALVPEWARDARPDTTLTESGKAADASVVGNKVSTLQKKDDALSQEIATERARINNLVAPSGSDLTLDAEVIDGRVDFKGKTHPTLGEAIRTQMSTLNEDVETAQDLLNHVYEETDTVIDSYILQNDVYGVVQNVFLTQNGSTVSYTSGAAGASDFIPTDGINVYVTAKGQHQGCIATFYNEAKECIGYIKNNSDGTAINWHKKKIDRFYINDVCPNASYVRFSSVYTNLLIYKAEKVVLSEKLNALEGETRVPDVYEDITDTLEITQAYIDKQSGVVRAVSNQTAWCTEPIEVNTESVFAITGTACHSTAIMALYDSNQAFLCSYGCNSATLDTQQPEYGRVVRFVREIFTKERLDTLAKTSVSYIRVGTYIKGEPLAVENVTFASVNKKVEELVPTVKQLEETVERLATGANIQPWIGKVWVAFGDSLTEENQCAEKHYHTNIGEEMGITVLNHGTSGSGYFKDGNEAWYLRINDVANLDFDVITFFGSGNDMSSGLEMGTAEDTGLETLGGAINTTLDNLFAIKPFAKVGIITPTPWRGNMPYDNGKMKQYSDLLIEVAKRRSIPYLDLFRCSTLDPNRTESLNEFYYNADGCHPNDEGHKRITPQIREFLRTLL